MTGKHSRFNMASKSKPLPHGFKSRSVLVAIFDMIVAHDFLYQKIEYRLDGKTRFWHCIIMWKQSCVIYIWL